MEGERTFLSPLSGRWSERSTASRGIDETAEQSWKGYAVSVLSWHSSRSSSGTRAPASGRPAPQSGRRHCPVPGPRLQHVGQLRDQHELAELRGRDRRELPHPDAVLAVRNFTSAATGLAVAIALLRGLTRRTSGDDRELLGRHDPRDPATSCCRSRSSSPSCSSGRACRRRSTAPCRSTTLQGAQQTIARGPVATQEVIKQLGNNGGGFFNANSAHPFENPTPLTNLLAMVAMFAIPFALTYTFGRYAKDQRQGWVIFGAMAAVFLVGAVGGHARRSGPEPALPGRRRSGPRQHGGQGDEFGAGVGALWAAITTSTSTGAINAWHDSFQPLGGLVTLFNMELGEITPGGIGAASTGCSSSARSCRSSSPASWSGARRNTSARRSRPSR